MPQDNSNLYDDAPAGPADGADKSEPAKADEGGQTFIAPKSAFTRELKPGDKCDVTITAVHEDDYEMQGCDSSSEEDSEAQSAPSSPGGDGSMSSLME